jgi:hypothetical protein
MPGDHVLRANAPGYFEAQQKVHVAAGPDEVPIAVEMVAMEIVQRGRLVVRTNVLSSTIAIDDVAVGSGSWQGEVPVGAHRIAATATGYQPHTAQVTVTEQQPGDVTIDMASLPEGEAPPAAPVRTQRVWYASAGVGVFGETIAFASVLDDTGNHDFGGGSFLGRGGRWFGPYLGVGLFAEIGGMGTGAYQSAAVSSQKGDKVSMVVWTLAPELRVRSPGKTVRAVGGLALGLEGQWVNAQVGQTGQVGLHAATGGGSSVMAMLEGGGQVDLGRAYIEATLFGDMHGLGAPRTTDGHLFSDVAAFRAGLRLQFGYMF